VLHFYAQCYCLPDFSVDFIIVSVHALKLHKSGAGLQCVYYDP